MSNIIRLNEMVRLMKKKLRLKDSILSDHNTLLEGKQDTIVQRVWAKLDKAKTKVKEVIDQLVSSPSPRTMQLQPVQNYTMRKSIYLLVASALMTTTFLAGCDTPAQKAEIAQENVKDSVNLDKVDQAYLADMENYINETTQKLEVYTKNILAFKAGIENEKQENKAEYQNRITALEQQNSELKMKMENFEAGGKEKWETLKTEVNQGMDKMDRTLNDSMPMDRQ